jgi:hypothetical protein
MPPVRDTDTLGTAVAFALGSAVGVGLAYPAVPSSTSLLLGGVRLSPAETFLLVGVVVIVSLPVLFTVVSRTVT